MKYENLKKRETVKLFTWLTETFITVSLVNTYAMSTWWWGTSIYGILTLWPCKSRRTNAFILLCGFITGFTLSTMVARTTFTWVRCIFTYFPSETCVQKMHNNILRLTRKYRRLDRNITETFNFFSFVKILWLFTIKLLTVRTETLECWTFLSLRYINTYTIILTGAVETGVFFFTMWSNVTRTAFTLVIFLRLKSDVSKLRKKNQA